MCGRLYVGPRNRVSDGGLDPKGKDTFEGDMCRSILAYLRITALRIVRLSTWADEYVYCH